MTARSQIRAIRKRVLLVFAAIITPVAVITLGAVEAVAVVGLHILAGLLLTAPEGWSAIADHVKATRNGEGIAFLGSIDADGHLAFVDQTNESIAVYSMNNSTYDEEFDDDDSERFALGYMGDRLYRFQR